VAMATQDNAQPDLDAYIALPSISTISSIPGQVITDSAASDHWICDKKLLKDLVPLISRRSRISPLPPLAWKVYQFEPPGRDLPITGLCDA
jgi:hypothetical protein